MVIFGHRRGGGGGSNPQKSRNYLFLGKFFKFQGGSGPPVPPSGFAHAFQGDTSVVVLFVLCLGV